MRKEGRKGKNERHVGGGVEMRGENLGGECLKLL